MVLGYTTLVACCGWKLVLVSTRFSFLEKEGQQWLMACSPEFWDTKPLVCEDRIWTHLKGRTQVINSFLDPSISGLGL